MESIEKKRRAPAVRRSPHVLAAALLAGAAIAIACTDDTTVVPLAPRDAGADATPDGAAVLARGARVLALDIGAAEDGDYLAALARAKDAGVEATNVTIRWPDLESVAADAGADAAISYFNP